MEYLDTIVYKFAIKMINNCIKIVERSKDKQEIIKDLLRYKKILENHILEN